MKPQTVVTLFLQFFLYESYHEHETDPGPYSQILSQETDQRFGLFVAHDFGQHVHQRNVDEHAGSYGHDPQLNVFVRCNLNT